MASVDSPMAEDSPMADRQPVPEVDAVWNDTAADVVLVSSDNVTFHVASYYLLGQSTLPSSTHPKRIELPDEECETAACIRLFLQVATRGYIRTTFLAHPRSIIRTLLGTLRFCKKYDCPAVPQTIKLWLHHHAASEAHRNVSLTVLDVFIIACKLDMYDLAADAIRYWQPPPWDEGEYQELETRSRDRTISWNGWHIHPAMMCLSAHEELSKLVIYVLCRAHSSEESQDSIAHNFSDLMNMML
ncbi:hypothetical protein IAT38_003127 [Cryptococcus sp. DSM 104549]